MGVRACVGMYARESACAHVFIFVCAYRVFAGVP